MDLEHYLTDNNISVSPEYDGTWVAMAKLIGFAGAKETRSVGNTPLEAAKKCKTKLIKYQIKQGYSNAK